MVASSCGAVVGKSRHNAAVGASGSFGTAGVTKAVPGSLARAWVTASRAAGSVPSGISVAEQQRPVEARSEAGGQQIVCLTGGRLLRVVALVGEGEPLTEEWHRSTMRIDAPLIAATHGRCWMKRLHR